MTNYIDTRELYKRQCELQEELDDLESELADMRASLDDAQDEYREAEEEEDIDQASERVDDYIARIGDAEKALADWKEEYQTELEELDSLENEVGRKWTHGETLIPEQHWMSYAMDMADDLHGRDSVQSWPFNYIYWDQAADELKMDYTEVEYQGETYLFRS